MSTFTPLVPPDPDRTDSRSTVPLLHRDAPSTELFEAVKRWRPGSRRDRVRPRRDQRRIHTLREMLPALVTLMRGNWLGVIMVLALVAISALLGLVFPASPKFAIDYLFLDRPGLAALPDWFPLPRDRELLLLLLAGSVIVAELSSIGLDITARFFIVRIGWRLDNKLRRHVFNRMLGLPFEHLAAYQSGGLSSTLRSDASAPGDIVRELVSGPWRGLLKLGASLGILLMVDPVLLLVMLGAFPPLWYIHRRAVARIRRLHHRLREVRQGIDAYVVESAAGIKTTRALGVEKRVSRQYTRSTHLLMRLYMHVWWRLRVVTLGWRGIQPIAAGLLLGLGGLRVISGELTLGDLTMFLGFLATLLRPMEGLINSALRLQDSLAGFSRSLEILEKAGSGGIEAVNDAGKSPPETLRGELMVEDATFAYPGQDEPVLRNFNLRLEPHKITVLVGPSGAGKSTAVGLLMRFFAPQSGRVTLDGVDVRTYGATRYRHRIGYVDQQPWLIASTIRENIAMGRPDATQAEIERAATLAHAHSFIQHLPDGYHTQVDEAGASLSAGQRQRVALARALLRDPALLVLDEAASNLDGESEEIILQALSNLRHSKTIVLVSHRRAAVRCADQVVLVRDGGASEPIPAAEFLARPELAGILSRDTALDVPVQG